MTMQQTAVSMDALRRAIEGADAAAMASFYAPDAVLRVVDKLNPPSRPREFRGRKAISDYYADICGRAMSHRIESQVGEGDRLAFTEACEYPDGMKVFCSAMIELDQGRIARQVNVQAWDE
jgi:ketosteroid isomerase-like protein